MKVYKIYSTTGHRGVLKKAYKLLISKKQRICERCPYHRGENPGRKRRDRRN